MSTGGNHHCYVGPAGGDHHDIIMWTFGCGDKWNFSSVLEFESRTMDARGNRWCLALRQTLSK